MTFDPDSAAFVARLREPAGPQLSDRIRISVRC
jgi:hypothetical protein